MTSTGPTSEGAGKTATAKTGAKRHEFDATVLREYDVRGIVGDTLFPADAYALGRAFGTVVRRRGGRAMAVGYDGRHSSPELAAALIEGLGDCGLHVVNVGRGPTPMVYFAAHTLDVQGGVMITGSHNPPEYNGFKLLLGKASYFGEDLQELGRMAAAGDYESGSGSVEERSLLDAYVDRVVQDLEGGRALKVAWDAGNGAMGEAMAAATARLPGEHILLNEAIDGSFPAHHPDPTVPENLKQLQDVVLSQGCDLGVAFDGDGDRIGMIDSQARILWGDQIMLYLARDILKQYPGATIIADVKTSDAFFDGVAAAGGKPLMWMTGHSIIKAKMKEVNSPFAGEMSAHIFFADHFYGYDDALYAAIRVMSVINKSGESLADFRDSLPPLFNTPEIRFPCPEDRKKAVIAEVEARLQAAGAQVNDIDGVRVAEHGGWWLLRASNTQDVLVARCEAGTQENLDRLIERVRGELRASGLEWPADQ